MATFKIIRIYELPGKDRVDATNRMMEALALGVDEDYHTMDYIKSDEDPAGKGRKVSLKPSKSWTTEFLDQLLGRARSKTR